MTRRNAVTLMALASVIAGCSAKTPGARSGSADMPGVGGTASAADLGARIYSGNCVPCHQQSGAGIPGVYPSLSGSSVVVGDPAELARWVLEGRRPASMPQGRYSTQMLQFGWMKPADAAALLSYLRSNFGNSAAPVDAATVAKALAP